MKLCPRVLPFAFLLAACRPSGASEEALQAPDAEPFGVDFCATLESSSVILKCAEHVSSCDPPKRYLPRTVDAHCPDGFIHTCTDGVRLIHFYPASGVGLCEDVGLLEVP